jgi:glutathione S-transferase
MVLAEKKLDYQFLAENVWSDQTQIAASNPLGKVPCLSMEGGESVFDSRVIVEYIDTLSPVGKLIPSAGRERVEVKTWEALADGLLDASILARLESTWTGRTETERSAAWIARQMKTVHLALQAMERGLGDKAFCAGIHMSLSDIAVVCALGYLDFRFPHIDWRRPHPNLHKLHDKMALRASFIDTQPQ